MTQRALITGITGQDGSYLAELLLARGVEVHGLIRRSSSFNTGRIDHLYKDPHQSGARLFLHYGDLADSAGLAALVREVAPDEIYNLAAQSHVRVSFDLPVYTADIDATGALRLLEAARELSRTKRVKFFQASSSEMFGKVVETPQRETTPFYPRSPYACAKVYAFHQVVNYREAYGMFAVNGILFNHESPRRGETFVTRKITRAATRIALGLQEKLYLGNLDARRDWGFAGDYMRAVMMMMAHDEPSDWVIATGESYSVSDFLDRTFARLNLDWKRHVEFDPRYLRPTEVDTLLGDSSKARGALGWVPEVGFDELIAMMVENDLELARDEKAVADARLARGAL